MRTPDLLVPGSWANRDKDSSTIRRQREGGGELVSESAPPLWRKY